MELWIDPIPDVLRAAAAAAFADGDVCRFLGYAGSNTRHVDLVMMNAGPLLARGLYERALVEAFHRTRTNNHMHSVASLCALFAHADRARLRAAEPLPGPGPFAIYRGVGGRGPARRVRGLSWTADIDKARWFAERARGWGLADPAVYTATVAEPDVLAYVNAREEQEFIVFPDRLRPRRAE